MARRRIALPLLRLFQRAVYGRMRAGGARIVGGGGARRHGGRACRDGRGRGGGRDKRRVDLTVTVPAAANIDANLGAGNVEVSGTLPSGTSLDIVDQAGNVTLALPRETSARLDATSNAGNITVDPSWPVAVSRAASNASVTGTLGTKPTGAVTIHVDAGNSTLNAQ